MNVTKAGFGPGHLHPGRGPGQLLLTVQGQTYLNAPTAFWIAEIATKSAANQAGGAWAKAPSRAVNLNFASLTPAKLAGPLEHVGQNPNAAIRN